MSQTRPRVDIAPIDDAAHLPHYAEFRYFLYIKGCCFFIIVVSEHDVAV
jgi:hypothetical protein